MPGLPRSPEFPKGPSPACSYGLFVATLSSPAPVLSQPSGMWESGSHTVLNHPYNENYNALSPIIVLLCLDTIAEQRITPNFYLIAVLDQDLT